MSAWDNTELTEPKDGDYDDMDAMTLLGDLREGDTVTLTFETDMEEGEIKGDPVGVFEVTVEEIPRGVTSLDGNTVAAGDRLKLKTGSNRLLSEMKAFAPVDGKTLTIEVEGTGFDAAYSVSEE